MYKKHKTHKRHSKLKTFRHWYQHYSADQMLYTRRA